MQFLSTRALSAPVSGPQAVLQGIAPDGGLYVPQDFPSVSLDRTLEMGNWPYARRAAFVLSRFFPEFEDRLLIWCEAAYGPARFDGPYAAPIRDLGEFQVLELFHGPTLAFKDMALQMLPRLMTGAMGQMGTTDEVVILTATSGDTGKAALEGFCGVPGTRVIVFYPEGGVSPAQRLQMVTQRGENVHVCAVRGNFDDAQTGVKRIFADEAFAASLKAHGKVLSSANSINFGRLAPQIAYYFSAYADLVRMGKVRPGQALNVCVPTGNFGNILAAWYAKRMGLPLGRLLCASNRNHVLTDFIQTGVYDAGRPFYKTSSPSMDILISSNVERLLFELAGRDGSAVAGWMGDLNRTRRYALEGTAAQTLKAQFYAGWVDDETAAAEIRRVYRQQRYVLDPHSAVASAVCAEYRQKTGDTAPVLVVSTASPYKFSRSVLSAIDGADGLDDFACAARLEALSGVPMPPSLRELQTLPQIHTGVCEKAQMPGAVAAFLGL